VTTQTWKGTEDRCSKGINISSVIGGKENQKEGEPTHDEKTTSSGNSAGWGMAHPNRKENDIADKEYMKSLGRRNQLSQTNTVKRERSETAVSDAGDFTHQLRSRGRVVVASPGGKEITGRVEDDEVSFHVGAGRVSEGEGRQL